VLFFSARAHLGAAAITLLPAIAIAQVVEPSTTTDMDGSVATIEVEPLGGVDLDAPARRRPGLGGQIEEIVVTAQKREQSIGDVSIAISAFSGDDMKALGIVDTRDLGAFVPGFTYADSGFNTPVYTLRGIGFNEASQTASSTVGVYVDEFNLPFPVMSKGANLDLERVEVLKGPQGTLYGRNTTGGAVNYIANRAGESFEAGLSAGYSSYETWDAEAYVSGPVADDLRVRLAARSLYSGEGWQTSLTRPDDTLGRKDRQSARLGVDWDATDALDIRVTLDGWRDRSEPQAPQAVYIRAQNPVLGNLALHQQVREHPLVPADTDNNRVADWTTGLDYRLNDSFIMGTLRADWHFADTMTLSALAAGARFESDGSTLPQSGLSVQYVTDRVIDVDTRAQTFELRISGDPHDDLHWLAGVFVSTDEVSEVQDYYAGKVSAVFPLPGELGSPIADRLVLLGEQEADSYAAFGSVEWRFHPALKLTLGARYTREKRRFSGCSADSPDRTSGIGFGPLFELISLLSIDSPQELLGLLGTLSPEARSDRGECFTTDVDTGRPGRARPDPLDEDNLSGRVALDWHPADTSLVYASFSRGFKSGSFPILSSSRSDQYAPVTQERLDGLFQVNAAAFWYDYKDKQLLSYVNDAVFGPLPLLENAPESRVIGAELELQANPLERLYLSAAVTWLDAKVESFTGTNNEGDTQDFAGQRFNFTPEWSWTLLLNYRITVSETLLLTLGADYSFTGETNAQLGGDPRFHQPEYALINARVALGPEDQRWSLSAFGRNLTDEYYVIGIFNPGDTIGRYTGMTRTWGVGLSYTFF
jgi:iron complex outermembrane recepter protein